jgi:hypothetical protein
MRSKVPSNVSGTTSCPSCFVFKSYVSKCVFVILVIIKKASRHAREASSSAENIEEPQRTLVINL